MFQLFFKTEIWAQTSTFLFHVRDGAQENVKDDVEEVYPVYEEKL